MAINDHVIAVPKTPPPIILRLLSQACMHNLSIMKTCNEEEEYK